MPVADLLGAGAGALVFGHDRLYGAGHRRVAARWPMKGEAGEAFEAGRGHIIRRPRLTRLLDETNARIVLLVAPAGYGKTTLAREWMENQPHCWYRGTSATADVAALALGLARAAATIVPEAGERMTTRLRLSSAPTEEVEALAELLAGDLSDWPAEAWLAFDDYQFACDSEPAERFVEHLASSCPVRLLVSGRSRPSWATARRLLYGEIYEIGRNLLAMNHEEARFVLRSRAVDETGGLISLADGWPALIGLAALATELEMPAEGVPEELYTFFAEELYQATPPEIQQGLRRLSLAPVITPDIAQSLIGEHATEVISEGVELGFFLSGPRDRLEFHPLLRSFLASKFRQRTDDPRKQILGRLAQALMDREEWDDVFELATHFLDDDLLIMLVQAALPRMLEQARLPTLSRWIGIATARGVDSPLIDLVDAELAFRRGELERGEALAAQAARRLHNDHPLRSKALWVAGTSAHLTWRDEVALKHFGAAEQSAHTELDARQALWGRFIATEALERERESEVLLTAFIDRSENTVDELLRIATGRFRMALLLGRVRETIESHRSLALLADRSRDPLIQTSFLNSYAGLLAIGGLYEETLKVAENEMSFAGEYLLDFVVPFAHFHVAESKWGVRNFRACKRSLAHSQRMAVNSNNEFLMSNVGTLHARLSLASGAPDEALRVLDRWYRAAQACPMHAEYLAWWSLAHAVAGQTRYATTLAARAETMSRRIEVSALVPWTKAILAMNGRRSADDAAEGAFRVALESGNIDAFVAAYRARPELLKLLARDEANHGELRIILERARDHALAQSVGLQLPSAPEQEGPRILSKREREVLQLVTQGLGNREIGRTLFIAEGTAKVHVRNICKKFGVRTRTEAAMRASELSD